MPELSEVPYGERAAAPSNEAQDTRVLRQQLRDVAAMLALPALWRDRRTDEIGIGLLDVLVSMLRLDVAHLRLMSAASKGELQFWRPAGAIQFAAVVNAFTDLEPAQALHSARIANPAGSHPLSLARLALDLPTDPVLVVIGSERPDFPTEHERFLFRAAVDQAAVAIESARLYEQAQRAVELRDEFFSVAAHELRTPLTALGLGIELLQRQLARGEGIDPATLGPRLQGLTAQSKKLGRLVGQLLDVSRIELGKLTLDPEELDLVSLVSDVVSAMQPNSDRHALTLDAPAAVWMQADPLRLEQVFTNLLDNAMKYSPNGGPVEVEIGSPRPELVEITVADRGLGIPPECREQIFDRFYRAHQEQHMSGMGIGLFVSKQIVDLHGGDIRVDSPSGGGTRFVVRLPLVTTGIPAAT